MSAARITYSAWIASGESADYYMLEGGNEERLTSTTIEDALDGFLGDLVRGTWHFGEEPITVHAFRCRVASLDARVFVEDVLENLDEEYAGPDSLGAKPSQEDLADMQAALDAICKRYDVWSCDEVAEILVSEADARAMLKAPVVL